MGNGKVTLSAPSSRRYWIALAALVLSCSSDEPVEAPVGSGFAANLRLGDSMTVQTLPIGRLRNEHRLTVSAPTLMAIFVEGRDGSVTVAVELEEMGPVLGAGSSPGLPLLQSRTSHIHLSAGKTLKVLVSRNGEPDTASAIHYRLFAYPVKTAPEHGPATASIGQVRTGEDLETSADIDEYSISVPAGSDVVTYLANDGPGPSRFSLVLFDRNGGMSGNVAAPPVGVPLEDNGSRMLTIPTGSFIVRAVSEEGLLSGTSSSYTFSRYTFLVRQGNRAPENAPPTTGTGTVVSESFDYNGDVDEFTVHGTTGALVNLILESNSSEPISPWLETFGDGVEPRRALLSEGRPLYATTGALPVPPSGDIRFRVFNYSSAVPITGRGAYRVRVVQINPGPETASPSLTGTDSIIGEQIDQYDDRDEFTLAWPAGGVANIVLRTPGDFHVWDPLRLHLTSMSGDSIQSVVIFAGLSSAASGPFDLPAGNYRVRVVTSDGSSLGNFRGPYSGYFSLLSLNRASARP